MIGTPRVYVECDECGYEEDFELSATVRGYWDESRIKPEMKRYGWSFEGDLTYCQDCTVERKERKEKADE